MAVTRLALVSPCIASIFSMMAYVFIEWAEDKGLLISAGFIELTLTFEYLLCY